MYRPSTLCDQKKRSLYVYSDDIGTEELAVILTEGMMGKKSIQRQRHEIVIENIVMRQTISSFQRIHLHIHLLFVIKLLVDPF